MTNSLSPDGLTVNAINSGQVGGNRNLIINGAMQVAQRGTSTSVTTSSVYTLDRWEAVCGSSFNFDTTITQSTTAPSGFPNSLKVEADSVQTPTGSENGAIWTNLEGQNLQHLGFGSSDAKSITLSFWVRSNKTGTYSCFIKNNDALYYQVKEYSISSSNTWEYKTITVEPDTANSIDNDNGSGMQIAFNLATGPDDKVSPTTSWVSGNPLVGSTNQVNFMDSASNEWYITGIQLEVGSTATEFEHRSFGDELRRCQRYFQPVGMGAVGRNSSTTGTEFCCQYRVPMRANATVTYGGFTGAATQIDAFGTSGTMTITGFSSPISWDDGAYFTTTVSSGLTSGAMAFAIRGDIAAADAEL